MTRSVEQNIDHEVSLLKKKATDLEALFDQQLALIEYAIDSLRTEMVTDRNEGALHESVIRRLASLSKSLESVGKTRVAVAAALKKLGERMTFEERLNGAYDLIMSLDPLARSRWVRKVAVSHNELSNKAPGQPGMGEDTIKAGKPVTALQKMLEAVGGIGGDDS